MSREAVVAALTQHGQEHIVPHLSDEIVDQLTKVVGLHKVGKWTRIPRVVVSKGGGYEGFPAILE